MAVITFLETPVRKSVLFLLGLAILLAGPAALGQNNALKQANQNLVLVNIVTSTRAPDGVFKDLTIVNIFPSTGIVMDGDNHIVTYLGWRWVKIRSGNPRVEVIESQGQKRKGRIVGIDQSNTVAVIEYEGKALRKTPLCQKCEHKDIATVVLPPQEDPAVQRLESAPVVSISTGQAALPGEWTVQISRPLTLIGGPLLDARNQVVAIVANQEIQADPANMKVTISPLTTSQFLNSAYKIIKANGDIATGWLGVYIDNNYKSGVFVTDIDPNSPAHKAGIHPGDVIVKWNGAAISDWRKYIEIVQNTPVGTTAVIDVIRGGRVLQLQAVIEARRSPLP